MKSKAALLCFVLIYLKCSSSETETNSTTVAENDNKTNTTAENDKDDDDADSDNSTETKKISSENGTVKLDAGNVTLKLETKNPDKKLNTTGNVTLIVDKANSTTIKISNETTKMDLKALDQAKSNGTEEAKTGATGKNELEKSDAVGENKSTGAEKPPEVADVKLEIKECAVEIDISELGNDELESGSIKNIVKKLKSLEARLLQPTPVKPRNYSEVVGEKLKCHFSKPWKSFAEDKIIMCPPSPYRYSWASLAATFRFCTHFVQETPDSPESFDKGKRTVAAMKDAGIQVILNYSISLNAEFVRTRETAPFLNNSFEIMRADGLLVDWSENDLISDNFTSADILKLVVSLSGFLKPKDKMIFLRPRDYSKITNVPHYGSLDKFADFWIVGPEKANLNVTSIFNNLADMEGSIKVNSKTVNPKKLVYEAMHTRPFFELKNAGSSAIGSPATILLEGSETIDRSVRYGFGWTTVCDSVFPEKRVYNGTSYPSAYATHLKYWTSFENTTIIKIKMELLKRFNASGVWIVDIDSDDNMGWLCRCGYYPLMRTITEELRGNGGCQVDGCLA